MGHYIPRLARISSGQGTGRGAVNSSRPRDTTGDVERLTRLLPQIRERLALGDQFSDDALLASLLAIARQPSHETRWRAAETSTLGQYLASSSDDLHGALVSLLSLLPGP